MVAKLQKLKSLWIAKICLLQRLSKAQFSRELLSRHETYVSLCVCVWRERERERERERGFVCSPVHLLRAHFDPHLGLVKPRSCSRV